MADLKNQQWLDQPSRRETIIFGSLGIFAIVALMVTMTDFGSEAPFRKWSIPFWFLWINSVFVTFRVFANRWKVIQKP